MMVGVLANCKGLAAVITSGGKYIIPHKFNGFKKSISRAVYSLAGRIDLKTSAIGTGFAI